jgi:hypothetical protein
MRGYFVSRHLCAFFVACLFLSGGRDLFAAPASETLEKAIYTEETLGKLEDAIKLYEQVIAEATVARGLAAQAQYRLGLVLEKQGKKTAATEAFEKLVKDYPNETDLIAKARTKLPTALKLEPAPWKDHEALQLNMKFPNGLDIGSYLYRIDSETADGRECWRCKSRVVVTLGDGKGDGYSTVLVDKHTFAPIRSYWNQSVLGIADAVYKPNVIELKNQNASSAREISYEPPIFDNEEGVQLMRRLPLAIGYSTTLKIFPSLTGVILPLECKVVGKELVETPAGKFDCFKVNLSIVNQTFYFSADEHRYLVKFEAGGISVELARIFAFEPGQSTTFNSEEFRCTLPPDWFTYAVPAKEKQPLVVCLLNTDNMAIGKIVLQPRSNRKSADTATAWRDSEIEEYKNSLVDLQVREGGLANSTVAGSPAASFIADFKQEDRKMALYDTEIFGDQSVLSVRTRVAADQLDAFRKQLDQVIQSIQWK